jgi:hypothetical protein
MTRLRPFLLRLLLALLIMQGVAAPAHCLGDDAPAPHHGQDGCLVCHVMPQGPVPQGPQLWLPGSLPVARAIPWAESPPPVRDRTAHPYAARAPPAA